MQAMMKRFAVPPVTSWRGIRVQRGAVTGLTLALWNCEAGVNHRKSAGKMQVPYLLSTVEFAKQERDCQSNVDLALEMKPGNLLSIVMAG